MQPQEAQIDFSDGNIYFKEIARPPLDLRRNQYDLFAGETHLWNYKRLVRRCRPKPIPKEQAPLF